ncbi:HpcH/HpaI aldolase family protein [Streptomyces blattellae]|uniref:HpcH/HpaI aldolase family protein n=1 Tax=Streptomyces blattellae TaxID=2569855 RepID=UPI0012B77848|nr:aldolase/citrate lyase family protein [Streptomyces blattellae]
MRKPHRRIRSKLEEGGRAFGIRLQLPSPDIAEIAGYAGADFVWLDAEHGTMDLRDIGEVVRAADASGIDAIVRVPDHSASFIQRVLDTGAAGIIAPHVRTVAEAAAIAEATRFGPTGTRGACASTRAFGHHSPDWPADRRRADADVFAFGVIEDADGMENVEAIARESGLDGLLFGAFDLAQDMGLEGDVAHPDIDKVHQRFLAAVRAAGTEYLAVPGWGSGGVSALAEHARLFSLSGDRAVLATAFRTALVEGERALMTD